MQGDAHMFPFDFLQRSESARKALQSSRVRIWEEREWGFWRPDGRGHTKNLLEAETFDFQLAWEIARVYGSPNELLFDPVNDDPETETKEAFESRWEGLLTRFRNEATHNRK